MLALWLLLPGTAGADSGCHPSGGAELPALEGGGAGQEFRLVGRGWGHGVGMSQYGARGAARLGCDRHDILGVYYPGTTVERAASTQPLTVGLFPGAPREQGGHRASVLNVYADAGNGDGVPWRLVESGGTATDLPAAQAPGRTWQVRTSSAGGFRVYDTTNNAAASETNLVWEGGAEGDRLQARMAGRRVVQLPSKSVPEARRGEWPRGRPYRHGSLQIRGHAAGRDMDVTVVLPDVDTYLYGLSEMPSSWEAAALQAQAVAGRSYAEARRGGRTAFCGCDLYDSQWDQVYSGYLKESEGADAQFGRRWVAAVDATTGEVLRHGGRTVQGFYASSHGGHSETNEFVWGGAPLPYLRPVDDSRWERASENPNLVWRAEFSAAELGQRLGVGVALDVRLPEPKGHAARVGDPARGYGGVVVTGTQGTRTFSGAAVRQRLGIRSTLFDVTHVPARPACAPPEGTQFGDVVDRAGGLDRYETAVRVAARGWDGQVDTVVLASGADFPDALAGAPLAGALDAPLLLTRPDRLPPAVEEALVRLRPGRVVLLGGDAAIGPAVEARVAGLAGNVERVRGRDRFATAAAIAGQVGAHADGTVLLALGQHPEPGRAAWPDALSAGAFAAVDGPRPVLLTRPRQLPEATLGALTALGVDRVVLVGGTAAIHGDVEAELRRAGYAVERVHGADRYATSAAAAGVVLGRHAGASELVFATGVNFPDGLAAGAVAARRGAALLLVPHCDLDGRDATRQLVTAHRDRLAGGLVVGGPGAVSERVRWQLEGLLR